MSWRRCSQLTAVICVLSIVSLLLYSGVCKLDSRGLIFTHFLINRPEFVILLIIFLDLHSQNYLLSKLSFKGTRCKAFFKQLHQCLFFWSWFALVWYVNEYMYVLASQPIYTHHICLFWCAAACGVYPIFTWSWGRTWTCWIHGVADLPLDALPEALELDLYIN